MKSLLFLFCCFVFNNMTAQFELQWKKSIPVDSVVQHVDQFDIIDQQVLFTLDNKISYLVDSSGNVVWSFDWNNHFTKGYSLQFMKNETSNQVFFVARHNHRDSLDAVGLFELDAGIIWRNFLEGKAHFDSFHGQDFVPFKDGALVIDVAASGNQLTYLSEFGILPLGDRKTDIDSYQNKLGSNGLDQITWVYNDKAHFIDDDGNLLGIDSSSAWNVSVVYSSVLMQDEALYHFNTSEINVINSEFSKDTSIQLPFIYNVFGIPWLEVLADGNNDLYFSGYNATGFGDDSFAFLVKLNRDKQIVWIHENENVQDYNGNLSNLNISSKHSLYTYDNQVVLIDSDNGKNISQDSLIANDMFMSVNRYKKSLVVDYSDKVFYALSFSDAESFISRHKLPSSVGLQNIQNDNSRIFPNPVSDILNLNTNDVFDKVEIFSLNGALIYKGGLENNKIFTKNLDSGTYILRLSNSEAFSIFKFIKQ